MEDIIKHSMGLCLELRDAFSGRTVEPSRARVLINGKMPAWKKDGRFFIFQGLGLEEELWVTIRAAAYEPADRKILCEDVFSQKSSYFRLADGFCYTEAGIRMLCLWLFPGRDYELPNGYVRQCVKAEPEEEVRIVKDPDSPAFLTEDYTGGRFLCISAGEESLGRSFRIGGLDEIYEDFTVAGRPGGQQICMEAELSRNYPRGSRVFELYCIRADEEGQALAICKK